MNKQKGFENIDVSNDNALEIDFDNIQDNYSKTMFYYTMYIFENYRYDESFGIRIQKILDSLILPKEITDFIGNDLEKLKNIKPKGVVDYFNINKDIGNIIDGKFIRVYDDYENLAERRVALNTIYELLENILYNYKNNNFKEIFINLDSILTLITRVNLAISYLGMKIDQANDEFDWSAKYMPSNVLFEMIKNLKSYFSIVTYFKKQNEFVELKIKSTIQIIKNATKFLEVQLGFLSYIYSPFYDKKHKDLVIEIYKVLQETLHDSFINGVHVDYSSNCINIPSEQRGKTDMTTFLQLTFGLDNTNNYSLRLDFPHKGVDYLHINVEDFNGESAIPLSKKDFNNLKTELGFGAIEDFKELFYEYNDKIWFTNNFETKLDTLDFQENQKSIILSKFKESSHVKIKSADGFDEKEIMEIFSDLRNFFGFINHHPIKKEAIDYKKEIYKTKLLFFYNEISMYMAYGYEDTEEKMKNMLLQRIYSSKSLDYKEISHDDMKTMSLKDILDFIEQEIF